VGRGRQAGRAHGVGGAGVARDRPSQSVGGRPPTHSATLPADEVQHWVLGLIGGSHRLSSRSTLGFARTDLSRRMVDGLVRRGYLTSPDRAVKYRRAHWLVGVVFAIGVVRVINGAALDRPIGFLLLSLVVTAPLWILAATVLGNVTAKPTTRARAILVQARSRTPKVAMGAAVLAPVALYGVTAYADDELGAILAQNTQSHQSSSGGGGSGCGSSSSCSSSSSSCSSSSSSCGGGGSSCGG
ncbi:MAG: TIGR04222 domain-containing membrane protein, partial [Actinomycetota bacterium]|nr:TIGR04222 domain-containing membrane protein [Actinomycetota bacterium]